MKKNILLAVVIILIGIAIYKLEPEETETKLTVSGLPEISSAAGFINTDKISISELVGKKVILVDFWTYSCINCQRTTPYLNAWYSKYKDSGFEIIGVHSPEFDFEKKYENVVAAVEKFGIKYPVVLDNDMATWDAFSNRYWPAKYLIDLNGKIVYTHFGEGDYDEGERAIQNALGMNGEISSPENVTSVDFSKVGSPEVYFGSTRGKSIQSETDPTSVEKNTAYLVGDWDFDYEFAENKSAAKIIYKYTAKNVYMVASSQSEGLSIKIFKDGVLVKTLDIKSEQLYPLIEDSDYGEHTLEIQIDNPGLQAFTFTFG